MFFPPDFCLFYVIQLLGWISCPERVLTTHLGDQESRRSRMEIKTHCWMGHG